MGNQPPGDALAILASLGEPWSSVAQVVSSIGLRSYKVVCPSCGERGIPFPKWISRVKKRPLYIIHTSRGNVAKLCVIPYDEIDGLNTTARLSRHDLTKLIDMDNIFVLFSGGKDSLCTLFYINDLCKKTGKKFTTLFIDTTVGFPEVTRYVKKTCKDYGFVLKVLKPKVDYYDLAKKKGIPTFKSRWCCEELKIKPVKNYLSNIKGSKIVFDGIRAAESNDRAKYFPVWYHPSFESLSVSPLFFWSDADIEKYIEVEELPLSPVNDLGSSSECWCGAYKTKSNFEDLFRLHPDIYEKLIEVEEANIHGFTFVYKDGKRISLKKIKAEINNKVSEES